MKTNEQLKSELYAPLPVEAIKPHPTKTFLSTIKPIYVTDRLNEVFGIGGWKIHTENILVKDNGTVVNKVTFIAPKYDIYYECFGGNDNGGQTSKGFDLGDAFKGATTDALTKICSYLGIGIDVFKGKQSHNTSTTPKTVAPAQPKAVTPTAIKPSTTFQTDDRKVKALKALQGVKTLSTVKGLIDAQKSFKDANSSVSFVAGATIEDVVKLNDIEVILSFYNSVK
jgi:hypothetical protein